MESIRLQIYKSSLPFFFFVFFGFLHALISLLQSCTSFPSNPGVTNVPSSCFSRGHSRMLECSSASYSCTSVSHCVSHHRSHRQAQHTQRTH